MSFASGAEQPPPSDVSLSSHMVMSKRRLKINTGMGRVAVLVPQDGTVADACAAAETSGRLGNRRIRTFALTDGCELIAADSISDAVEDGEELRPVFEEAGTGPTAESSAGKVAVKTSEGEGQGRDAKQLKLDGPRASSGWELPLPSPPSPPPRQRHGGSEHEQQRHLARATEIEQRLEQQQQKERGGSTGHMGYADGHLIVADPASYAARPHPSLLVQNSVVLSQSPDEDDDESEDEMKSLHETHFSSRKSPPHPHFPSGSSYRSLSSAPPAIRHPLGEEGATVDDLVAERALARGAHTEPVEHRGLDIAELKAAMTKKSAAQELLVEYDSHMSIAGAERQPSEVGTYIRYTGMDFAADDDCQGETFYW
jgi:hypothetical protein